MSDITSASLLRHVSFISVPALDPERARDFYRDKLGLRVASDEPFGAGRWIMMEIPGARTMIHFDPVGTMPETSSPALPLIAGDVPAAVIELEARGVEIARPAGPAEWDPATTYAMIRDSEGNLVLIASQ